MGRDHYILAKPSHCQFFFKEVMYLGRGIDHPVAYFLSERVGVMSELAHMSSVHDDMIWELVYVLMTAACTHRGPLPPAAHRGCLQAFRGLPSECTLLLAEFVGAPRRLREDDQLGRAFYEEDEDSRSLDDRHGPWLEFYDLKAIAAEWQEIAEEHDDLWFSVGG